MFMKPRETICSCSQTSLMLTFIDECSANAGDANAYDANAGDANAGRCR